MKIVWSMPLGLENVSTPKENKRIEMGMCFFLKVGVGCYISDVKISSQ